MSRSPASTSGTSRVRTGKHDRRVTEFLPECIRRNLVTGNRIEEGFARSPVNVVAGQKSGGSPVWISCTGCIKVPENGDVLLMVFQNLELLENILIGISIPPIGTAAKVEAQINELFVIVTCCGLPCQGFHLRECHKGCRGCEKRPSVYFFFHFHIKLFAAKGTTQHE